VSRKQVYQEIEEMLGLVPSFFKAIPDSSLEMEWNLFRRVQFEEGPIPNKYRELIGLGIAAVTKCRYCAFFHTEAAKLNGATDAEIEDAVHFAKSSAGWSALRSRSLSHAWLPILPGYSTPVGDPNTPWWVNSCGRYMWTL
jgi:AhpD family alkylhydroperoxidase